MSSKTVTVNIGAITPDMIKEASRKWSAHDAMRALEDGAETYAQLKTLNGLDKINYTLSPAIRKLMDIAQARIYHAKQRLGELAHAGVDSQ